MPNAPRLGKWFELHDQRKGDSGGEPAFHSCPDCGTALWWTLDSAPGVIAFAAGCFADPGFGPPLRVGP